MSSILQTIAWGYVSDAGVLINGRNATTARDVAGRYQIFLSEGFGVDITELMPTFVPAHVVGLINLKSPQVIALTDNQIDVFFINSLNAGIDTFFYFKIERLKIL